MGKEPETLTPSAEKLLAHLRKFGPTSAANLGDIIKPGRSGMNSNPGTLAASSVMRSLERRGLAQSYASSGKTHHRTMWRIARR